MGVGPLVVTYPLTGRSRAIVEEELGGTAEAIYLADRTVLMTAHPGRVQEIIRVDLLRPRRYDMRSEPRFIALRDHVTRIIRDEAIRGAAEVAA